MYDNTTKLKKKILGENLYNFLFGDVFLAIKPKLPSMNEKN